MSVQINYVGGKITRPLPQEEHISGMVFVDVPMPASYIEDGATGYSDVHRYTNIVQVEGDGITEDDPLTAVMYYHLNEFFRVAPGATVYVMAIETLDATEYVQYLQEQADGNIRQMLVLGSVKHGSLMGDEVASIQNQCEAMDAAYMPLVVLCQPGAETVLVPGSTFYDLGTFGSPNVSIIFGHDGMNNGSELSAALGVTIGCGGAALGQVAKSAVHESLAWVQKGNVSDGTDGELDEPAFANGDLLKDKLAYVQVFEDYRYVFLQKHRGIAGTYFNFGYNCEDADADLNSIERVRTVNKVKRIVRTALLPSLNSPVYVNPATGYLSQATIAYFESTAGTPLRQMVAAGELSGFEVYINPAQDILTTPTLTIQITLIPVGVAKNIVVNLSYAVTI